MDTSRNQQFLKTMPHKEVDNGMAIVFDVQTVTDEGEIWRMPVRNDVINNMDLDGDSLYEAAMLVVNEVDPAVLLTLERSMSSRKKLKNLFDNNKKIRNKKTMFVLSTKSGHCGAAALFYPGMAEKIAERLGDGFYAFPSSVNEYMIAPDSAGADIDKLHDKLIYDNATTSDLDNVLSDKILHYDREWKQLVCVSDILGKCVKN